MVVEFMRLIVGVLLMAFHRPIADFFVELDYGFTAILRSKGLRLPMPPRQSIMHTFYFCLGMLVCVVTMMKIFVAVRG